MQCQNCHYELPVGGPFCTNCGTPVTPSPGIAPTMLASSPNQGIPAPYPPTNYGEVAPPPPPGSYTPPQPYAAPPQPYSVPPQTPYGAPQAGQYGAPPPMYAQQPPKSNRGCVTALIIVLVLVVLVVGGVVAATAYVFNKASHAVATVSSSVQTAVPTINASLSATPNTNTGSAPTASQIDPNAATRIFGTQTSSGVNDVSPVDTQTTFHTGDKIYVTFKTTGAKGYILAKWYLDGEYAFANDVLSNQDGERAGYVAGYFNLSGTAVIGLYWCTQSDCSDAALAQVVTATVS